MGLPNAKIPLHQSTRTLLLAAASLCVYPQCSLHPNVLNMTILCN